MRRIFIFCFILLSPFSVFCQGKSALESILQPDMTKKLKEEGYIFQFGKSGIEYLDSLQNSLIKDQLKEIFYQLPANYTVQIIYFAPDNILPARSDLQIYNAVKNVESLDNSYVLRKGRKDPFMTKVHEYAGIEFKKRMQFTPLEKGPIPLFSESYFKAKDTRFGNTSYILTYRYEQERFMLNLTNESAIDYLIYPIAEKGKFSTVLMAQRVRGGILFILHTFVSLKNLKTAESNIDLRTFFSRRLEALKGWYFREVYGLELVQGILPEPIKIAPVS